MDLHRLLVMFAACLGLASVLTGCEIDGSVDGLDDHAAASSCGERVKWPEWPGTLPSTLTRDERALFERAWSSGPNFACDALLVTRGCGTGCVSGMIHDAGTRRTHVLSFAIHREAGQDEPPLEFREDSAILVANGWRNELEQGVFRYRWDGERLHRLKD